MSNQLEEAQKNRDNDLKIAILNFLSRTEHPVPRMVSPGEKSENFSFKAIYNYIKSV